MGQSMDRARALGHTCGRGLLPRRTGELGALADERASTETRMRESDDSRWSRSGANRRIRPRCVDFERFRIDSHVRQPMVRPRTNIGAVGTVRGVAIRIERAVQSTPRRLSANRGGSADIRSRGPTPDALIAPAGRHTPQDSGEHRGAGREQRTVAGRGTTTPTGGSVALRVLPMDEPHDSRPASRHDRSVSIAGAFGRPSLDGGLALWAASNSALRHPPVAVRRRLRLSCAFPNASGR